MILLNCELRMGKVIDVTDPDKQGRIKVEIFGYFDGCNKDDIPWSNILFRGHSGYHRTYKLDEIVYVLINKDNIYEYYHLDISSQNEALKEILNESYENTEVILCREGEKVIQLYFSDAKGFIQRVGDTWIKINPDDSVEIVTPWDKRTVHICEKSISLGTETVSAEPGVLGLQNEDALNKILNMFKAIEKAANSNPYTKPISVALKPLIPPYEQQIPKTKSENITLD